MIQTAPLTCTLSTPVPESRAELKAAVDSCIKIFSPVGDCAKGPHGPIGEWDVSHVTDMSDLFRDAALFNSDISKWDVSAVTTMQGMFYGARSFNGDVSPWNVSLVTAMDYMFAEARQFGQHICWDIPPATNTYYIFLDTVGACIEKTCGSVSDSTLYC